MRVFVLFSSNLPLSLLGDKNFSVKIARMREYKNYDLFTNINLNIWYIIGNEANLLYQDKSEYYWNDFKSYFNKPEHLTGTKLQSIDKNLVEFNFGDKLVIIDPDDYLNVIIMEFLEEIY